MDTTNPASEPETDAVEARPSAASREESAAGLGTSHSVGLDGPSHPALSEDVRSILGALGRAGGWDRCATFAAQLATVEALDNARHHGYRDRTDGRVLVDLRARADAISIGVEDFGRGVDADRLSDGPLAELESGGYGIYLMRQCMDTVVYETRRSLGTRVDMTRRQAPTEVDGTAAPTPSVPLRLGIVYARAGWAEDALGARLRAMHERGAPGLVLASLDREPPGADWVERIVRLERELRGRGCPLRLCVPSEAARQALRGTPFHVGGVVYGSIVECLHATGGPA